MSTSPIKPAIDYELLLSKYIEHVGQEEGATFISRLYRNGDFYEGMGSVKFTPAEYAALERVSDRRGT